MSDTQQNWLVISDLDGTLLNHDSYNFNAAKNAIISLQKMHIPIVLNTSKTFLETVTIRRTLSIHDAFIVENGSCLYLPKKSFAKPQTATFRDDYWEIIMGASQQKIEKVLEQIGITSKQCVRLSQCSIDEAIALTGLSREQAEQAIAREFSEPLIWQGDENALHDFQKTLATHGLTTLMGGRFLHVIGDCDKGRATRRLVSCYEEPAKTIVLGDSANDAAMLSMADISVMVNSPSNHQLQKLVTCDITTTSTAPEGWQEAIRSALLLTHNFRSL